MSFGVTVQKGCNNGECGQHSFRVLTCYTPMFNTVGTGFVSMVRQLNMKRSDVANSTLAVVPPGAIIDMIEYSGVNSFSAAGSFKIGLGQLNNNVMVHLIDGGTSLVANDNVGGCRQFISEMETGENNKIMVPYNSYVNFMCCGGIQSGSLRVDIYYHVKP